MEKNVVLYHNKCVDGFGAAYAAWKHFGTNAVYLPVSRGDIPPLDDCRGAWVYILDFCFEQDDMDAIKKVAVHVCVLDHHKSVEQVVKSMSEYVFDIERSGATIAWSYFHKTTATPKLLNVLEDGDLFRNELLDTRALFTYLEVVPYDFAVWDTIVSDYEKEATRNNVMTKANAWQEYFDKLVELSVQWAKLVKFEGHTVYFANSHPILSMRSVIGNELVKKQGPFSLVVSAHPEGYGVSIRGDGSVDVSAIAKKYGGGGHKSSSGFYIRHEETLPWELVEKE
jgi:oligoribonuclease NrnB/cAMP/cGMP phosphodiesterase (DHH superfamily)